MIRTINASCKLLIIWRRNFDQPITLNDVADQFFLSASYLSRHFKEQTGTGFNRYLMSIRLEHAMKDLLYTSHSISHIAMENGFPTRNRLCAFLKKNMNKS